MRCQTPCVDLSKVFLKQLHALASFVNGKGAVTNHDEELQASITDCVLFAVPMHRLV